jgi:hypothetical protein
MNVFPVPTEYLHLVWPEVSILFKPAIKYVNGRFDEKDVFHDLQNKLTCLWIAVNDNDEIVAAISVKIVDYPKRRFARYEIVGSKSNTILKQWGFLLFESIEEHAKNIMGCSGIEGGGRLGWVKMGAKLGYKCSGVFVEKDF